MKHSSWHFARRAVRVVHFTGNGAEMCRIPLNPAAFAVYLRVHTNKGEAACCCAR